MPILQPGRNVWRIEHADRLAVLIDGANFFQAVRRACLKARRSICIMGWDLDSRTRLVGDSGKPDDGHPAELAPFLSALVKERPGLNVRLLLWDYSVLYASEREPLPTVQLHWRTPSRVQFALDAQVPPGGSQHQKIVVIDDCLAFSGGLDITGHRWDTCHHRMHDPLRLTPGGVPYGPFHDVQAVMDGKAAQAVGAIFRERWRRVTGQVLPEVCEGFDPWPDHTPCDFADVDVGISRTQPGMPDAPEVREAEQLFLDSIDAAERHVYLENQFFTSSAVAERLARRMVEVPILETLLVGPQTYASWIEARTMRNGRIRFMRILQDAGVADRVRLLYPHIEEGTEKAHTMVHSKVSIIDDKIVRIGSANINNRSMGTDTECDVSIEAADDRTRRQILAVRNRLLADHTGASVEAVAAHLSDGQSLLRAAEVLSGNGHSLRAVDDGEPDPEEMARYIEMIADPERPIPADVFVKEEMGGRGPRLPVSAIAKAAVLLIAVIVLTALWQWSPLSEGVDAAVVQSALESYAQEAYAPLYAIAAFLVGGLVAFPVTLLIAGTAATFGPVSGFAYAAIGSLSSALLTYGIGLWLGRRPLQSIFGPRLDRIRGRVKRHGILAVTAIRLVPIAPFTLVNMVAGASRLPLWDYLIGTALGLLPGLLVLSTLGYQIFNFVVEPSAQGFLMLACAIALWLAVVAGVQMLAARLRGETS